MKNSTLSSFEKLLNEQFISIPRTKTEILQINVGKLCNLTCSHCHVNAGPKRKEIIVRETIDRILDWLRQTEIATVDLTGGAPEMVPDFQYLIRELRSLPKVKKIIDRCNLTILNEPGYEWLAPFLLEHRLEIVASMPCYSAANVNAQRGEGVFDSSILGLQKLNQLGFGKEESLSLHLVYNPGGPFLPPDQKELELDYKRELKNHFDIVFHQLFAITNMPISRYQSWLKNNGHLEEYMTLLREAFNPASIPGLMCRNTVNIGWQGEVYDCDFNQQLGLQWGSEKPRLLWEIDPSEIETHPITFSEHCFGCTAGCGSSCQGVLVN